MTSKQKLGQYFTTNIKLKEKVFQFILNDPTCILEPSIGQGHLVEFIKDKMPLVQFDMYEIDDKIEILNHIDKKKIIYGNFINQPITKTYKTIIGNPPYIKTTKGNLYIDFTKKCFHLLDNYGELIFIVPSDFIKLTSASKLLNEMMIEGTFTHIYHPHNENMFKNASIDIIIFRYCKNNSLEKKTIYNDKIQYITNSDGLITFSNEKNQNTFMFKDYFDIYVGIVSGKDNVFKNDKYGNIEVRNGQDKIEKFICITTFPTSNENINSYLMENKNILLNRGIKKFTEKNWFEWGALRNIKIIDENIGLDCIYLYNLTRKDIIAFLGKINYFGGSLLMLKPKKNIDIDLEKIVTYLNSYTFKNNFIFSNRFKIGHRQVSQSYIPNYIFNESLKTDL